MTQANSSMQTPYHQLTSEDRGQIQALHDQGYLQAAIARKLGYNRSTICRELKRGRVRQRDSNYLFYYCYLAHIQPRFIMNKDRPSAITIICCTKMPLSFAYLTGILKPVSMPPVLMNS